MDRLRHGGCARVVRGRVSRLAEHGRDSGGELKLVHVVDAVDVLGGRSVAPEASLRRQPVPQEVPGVRDRVTRVRQQEIVLRLRRQVAEPLLDHRVVGFEHALVAVLQVHLPRQGDDESAPHRAAAPLVRVVRRRVRQRTGCHLRIAPVGEPAVVQASGGEVEHPGFHRGSGVATVAQPLARRTVDHVAAQRQGFVGPGDHLVDLVQQLVGRGELAGPVVGGANQIPRGVGNGRRASRVR